MLVRYLRAQPVYLIVAAGNPDQLCPKDLCAYNFRRLKIGRNKNPALQTIASRLCRCSVGKVPSRGARNRIESKAARVGNSHGDHTVFEAQGWKANGVVLDKQILRAKLASQRRGREEWSESYWQRRLEILRKWQQGRIPPDVARSGSDSFASEFARTANRIVVVKNFQRRETLFANRFRRIAPALVAFPTAQF